MGPAERASDEDWLAEVARGDREALGQLYDRHAGLLLALASRMLGDAASAEVMVHDLFVDVWHRAAEFEAARLSVRAWLVGKLRVHVLDHRAHALDRGATAIPSAPSGPSASRSVANASLLALPSHLGAVIELAYFDALPLAEVAVRLAITTAEVRLRLGRALALLRGQVALMDPHQHDSRGPREAGVDATERVEGDPS